MLPNVKRWSGPAALLAVSLLFSALVGEAAVRWLRPGYVAGPDPIRNPFWQYDPELGWSHEPGATGVFARDEFSHPVRINQAGWRDRERQVDKPAGTFRVVVLGDSFTWGHGVGDEEVYTRLLEGMLPGTEFLNLGLSGSDTGQQLLILEKYGLAWHPDLVLLMMSRNDFIGNVTDAEGSYPKPMFVLEPGGELRLTNVPVPRVSTLSRLHYRLRRRSGLVNLIETELERWRRNEPEAGAPGRSYGYDLTRALLHRMHAECRSAGVTFAISFVPSNAHTYPETIPRIETERTSVVEAFANSEGIAYLDLVPAFREAARDPDTGARVDLHYRRDRHWNALGHRVAARALAGMLVRKGLVPTGPR